MLEPWRNPVTARRCDGKRPYRTEGYAIKVAQQDSERSGEYIVAYQCFDCRQWHVGHADYTQLIVAEQEVNKGSRGYIPVTEDGRRCNNPECSNGILQREVGLYCSRRCKRRAAKLRKQGKDSNDTGDSNCSLAGAG